MIKFLFAALVCLAAALPRLAAADPSVPKPESMTSTSGGSDYGVIKVWREGDDPDGKQPCSVKRGEKLWIEVWDLDRWLNDPRVKSKLPDHAEKRDLVPFLQGEPLRGIHPDSSKGTKYYDDPNNPSEQTRHTIDSYGFTLDRTSESKKVWDDLLKRPRMQRAMEVSVGFENGEQIHTWIVPKTEAEDSPFFLQIIPKTRLLGAMALILAVLGIFLKLARDTDIIRDTTAPLRPDRLRPYSLARGQMAFWFFLVITSFLFLWVLTGATDTLTESVLALVGISAGTALSAAIVDVSLPTTEAAPAREAPVDLSKSRPEIVKDYEKLITNQENALKDLQSHKPTAPDLAANQQQQDVMLAQISEWRRDAKYFRQPPWKGVMYDLLSENNLISFHRFQIFVWTLALGVVFVHSVYNLLAMPDFSPTLLGLLGISAGTYVGFKFPDRSAAASGTTGSAPG